MARRRGRRKHIPQRTCIACRTGRPKRELIRVVRTPDGEILVDETGKRNGRGAYICARPSCWEIAIARKHLDRALSVDIPAEAQTRLREYAAGLPQPLTADETPNQEEAGKGVDQNE